MRLVKRLLPLVLCLCLMTGSACAMGLNVTKASDWQLRVSWSERLNVSKVVVITGNQVQYDVVQVNNRNSYVVLENLPPETTYRISARDASGKELASAGEVTGSVEKWSKYGAVTGICEVVRRTNSDTSESIWDVSHPTVSSISASELDRMIDEGIPFHLHWKVQFKQKSEEQTLVNTIVLRAPDGSVYTSSHKTTFEGLSANSYWNCYPYLTGNGTVFNQYRQLNDSWQTGKYEIEIYADGLFVRETTMTVK